MGIPIHIFIYTIKNIEEKVFPQVFPTASQLLPTLGIPFSPFWGVWETLGKGFGIALGIPFYIILQYTLAF